MSETVKWSGYLSIAVNRRGSKFPSSWSTTAKLSVKQPTVTRDEVAVKVSVELPGSLFIRPQLEAKIMVPDHAVTPLVISMGLIDNVQELIRQNTGFDVKLVPVDGKEGA